MANPFKEADKKKKKAPGNRQEMNPQPEVKVTEQEPVVEVIPQVEEVPVKTESAPPQQEVVPAQEPAPVQEAAPVQETQAPVTVQVAVPQAEAKSIEDHFFDYQKEYYGGGRQEYVEARKQFTLTPALNKRLTRAVKTKEVRSANVLVNFLLEKYFSGELILKEKE